MRADRLLNLLLLLQSRPRTTARALAEQLEVSERTVYRDLDALSASGIPVTAARGPGGGVALLEGWKTSLTGFTRAEVHALAAVAQPAPLADLALSQPLQSGLTKLAASLPTLQQSMIEYARQRLHVDPAPFFGGPKEDVPHLGKLRDAAWQNQRVRLGYRDFEGRRNRRVVEPYGLVSKADRWYLVAGTDKGPATFRGSRVESVRLLPETFERPGDFDLATFWRTWATRVAHERPRFEVTLRLDAAGTEALRAIRPSADHARIGTNERITIDFERESIALAQLLPLGGSVEVLAPAPLREKVRAIARQLAALYA